MRQKQATRVFIKATHKGLETVLARTVATAAHVMHQVRGPVGRTIELEGKFGFCPSPGCAVVFLGSGDERFETRDLRHPPAYQTGNPTDLLCYCFDVTGDVALSPAADAAVGFISDRVRAGDCACDVLNPSAGCCLGSIATFRKNHTPPCRQRLRHSPMVALG